jgi:hypothetical protein
MSYHIANKEKVAHPFFSTVMSLFFTIAARCGTNRITLLPSSVAEPLKIHVTMVVSGAVPLTEELDW